MSDYIPPEVKVGTYVVPDGWRGMGEKLESGLDGFCDYYLPTHSGGPIKQVAVNVKVTGKLPRRRQDDFWARVQVTFVGDGEPNVVTGGWILYWPKN